MFFRICTLSAPAGAPSVGGCPPEADGGGPGQAYAAGPAGRGVLSYHVAVQRHHTAAATRGRVFPPGFPGGLFPRGGGPGGGVVHSLVKISSFLGKKRPFSSCVLRKFLLYCIHTGVRLSDDIFTMTGSIWYDVPQDLQCLTTSGNPIEDGAQATDSIKMSPAVRQGRPDGRAHDKSSRRRREF